MYGATIGVRRYAFRDLKTLLAKATPPRAATCWPASPRSGEENVAAKRRSPTCRCGRSLSEAVVPYESRRRDALIIDGHDRAAFAPVSHMTVGEFRDWLLSDEATTPRC